MEKNDTETIEKRKIKLNLIKSSNIDIGKLCNKYKISRSNLYRLASRDIKYDLILKDIYKNNLKINKDIEEIVFGNGKKENTL